MKERRVKPPGERTRGRGERPAGQKEPPVFQDRRAAFMWWFQNRFWYYHRNHLFLGIVLAAAVFMVVRGFVTNVQPDFTYVMTASQAAGERDFAEINDRFAQLTGDQNGDGRMSVSFFILSPTDNESLAMAYDMKFTTLFNDDLCSLFLFDDSARPVYLESDVFIDLSALDFPTPDGYPWIADISGLPLIRRAIPSLDGRLYAAVKAYPQEEDAQTYLSRELSVSFLRMLFSSP